MPFLKKHPASTNTIPQYTYPRRFPQAFKLPTTPSRAPAWAAANGPQVRRKNDPFSPQAWWGDDGARRVVKHVTAPVWHACGPDCGTPTPHAADSPLGSASAALEAPCLLARAAA